MGSTSYDVAASSASESDAAPVMSMLSYASSRTASPSVIASVTRNTSWVSRCCGVSWTQGGSEGEGVEGGGEGWEGGMGVRKREGRGE